MSEQNLEMMKALAKQLLVLQRITLEQVCNHPPVAHSDQAGNGVQRIGDFSES